MYNNALINRQIEVIVTLYSKIQKKTYAPPNKKQVLQELPCRDYNSKGSTFLLGTNKGTHCATFRVINQRFFLYTS